MPGRSVPPYERWVWTKRSASIATTGCFSRASWSSLEVSRVLVGVARGGVRARRISSGGGHRRDPGETLRQEDLGQGRLPGSGALHPRDLRQEQRPQVGLRDGVGGDPLGFEGMGLALPLERPGPFRALCRQAGQTPQEDNRVGLADALGAKATGTPSARSWPWPIAPTHRSNCSIDAAGSTNADHLRHPPAGWMPPSTNRPRHAARAR